MKVASIFLEGKYEDAFAYRGRLALFTKNHSIRFLNLEQLTDYLESATPASIPFTKMAFCRNDWLLNPQFRNLLRNPDIRTACLAASRAVAEPPAMQPGPWVEKESGISFDYDMLLDLSIYNGRIYFGCNLGLWSATMLWDKNFKDETVSFNQREDGTTIGISTRFGTANISCSERGLYSLIDDFRVLNADYGDGRVRNISPESVKSSWCKYDVVNYQGAATAVEIFPTNHMKRPSGLKGEIEHEMISSVQVENKYGFAGLFQERQQNKTRAPREINTIPWNEVEFSFNHDQKFYFHLTDGTFSLAKIAYRDRQTPYLASVTRSKKFVREILSFHEVHGGTVLETLTDIRLLTDSGDVMTLHPKPPLSLRTYPNSKQFRSLVTVVDDAGIFLYSVIPDAMFDPAAIFDPKGNLKNEKDIEKSHHDDDDEAEREDEDDEYPDYPNLKGI